jgi:hypothetical protein
MVNIKIFIGCLGLIISLLATHAHAVEFSLSAGLQSHSGNWETSNTEFDAQDYSGSGYHLGFSLKNQYGKTGKNFLGVGVDIDEILDDQVIGYRAIDYQRALSSNFRIGGFFGAASIDTGLPQNGYYMGGNISYYMLNNKLGFTFEVRYGSGLSRDRKLADDPQNTTGDNRPDIFLDYVASALQVSWTF